MKKESPITDKESPHADQSDNGTSGKRPPSLLDQRIEELWGQSDIFGLNFSMNCPKAV